MGGTPPKKRRTPRKQGAHRSHHLRKLAKLVNSRSPVQVRIGKRSKKAAKAAK